MSNSQHFLHLENRCNDLIEKYANPMIQAENAALEAGEPIPETDLDQLVALRLIVHAELEGYFEECARDYIDSLRGKISLGQSMELSALIMLYMQKKEISYHWQTKGKQDDSEIKQAEKSDFQNLANAAFGFASDFIKTNNGIKEASITMLAALSGKYPSDLPATLVHELNQLGIDRGAVAHQSHLKSKKANLQSPTIEKNRIESIIKLIKHDFDSTP